MTILAIQIDESVRPAKVVLQMHRMIELDRAGITVPETHRGEFRVVAVEASHGEREMGGRSRSMKICVALRATGVRRCSQT